MGIRKERSAPKEGRKGIKEGDEDVKEGRKGVKEGSASRKKRCHQVPLQRLQVSSGARQGNEPPLFTQT
jgi:hypothetical protein